MPSVEVVEFYGGESATATDLGTSSLQLEVALESVTLVGGIDAPVSVEITMPGPVKITDNNAVENRGGVTGLILLGTSDPIPAGLPAGTVVLRS